MFSFFLFFVFCNYIVPHLSFFPVTVAPTKGNGSYGKWYCVQMWTDSKT